MKAHPDIIGIYNAGGANSGIASVLERHDLGQSIMWIGHELTANSRRWLKSGLMDIVLDQAPEVQARRAVDTVLHRIGFHDVEDNSGPVRFLTINSENLFGAPAVQSLQHSFVGWVEHFAKPTTSATAMGFATSSDMRPNWSLYPSYK